MKLATFTTSGAVRIGVVVGEEVVDLEAHAPGLPTEMIAFLEAGSDALQAAQRAVTTAGSRIPLDEVKLEAPLLRPPKILAIGLNYADHVKETGREPPEVPVVFNKQSTAATGPYDPIHLPRASHVLDYEGELGCVIGRHCRHVPRERAHEVIAGYLIVNDVSVRDWQLRTPTMTMGKSWDTHCPMGPWITTADEVEEPHGLGLRTWVDGELRQDSNTKELIFDCFELVEHLSTAFTLEPGDVISTGTPGGVGIAMKPPKFLVAGDVVRIEIASLGQIENPVIAEPEDTARI
ncbi:MAG: fumarylacetoacetate hydrolase family protein [Myxococcota bacterium]|jgi:2-keto-4-pentenoate hydratase/2-oxohepta-3-ene-1,7-dioic acid hydratase in catechol pathway|nr:fumarylacetoacetate hydrolase [Deltaproteobacteria bacterium]MCP4242557.1 fumarylacetoacetate hydrolase family protein [bacterium]MDP6074364.1 fumarylacetoacetate hydrolase family protein [Myxococcota bacterium]MDP6242156.1 fumarylacetoacetate hydrolase family protein [Myxococcota bacterium]MDP7073749.1 fumarylacetoacetate hydrolase family protein [Myxococcota bacterium]